MAYFNGKEWVSSIPSKSTSTQKKTTSSSGNTTTSSSAATSTAAIAIAKPVQEQKQQSSNTTNTTSSAPAAKPAQPTNKTSAAVSTATNAVKQTTANTEKPNTAVSNKPTVTTNNVYKDAPKSILDVNPFSKQSREAYKSYKAYEKIRKELQKNTLDVRDTYDDGAISSTGSNNIKYRVNSLTATDYENVMDGLKSKGTIDKPKTINSYKYVTKHYSDEEIARSNGELQSTLTYRIPISVTVNEKVAAPPNTEIWHITDGNALKHISNYSTGVVEIGRDRLEGIDADTRAVLYDKVTGKIYKFDTPDTAHNTASAQIAHNEKATTEVHARRQDKFTEMYNYMKSQGVDITNSKAVEDKINQITGGDPDHKWTNNEYKALQNYVAKINNAFEDKHYIKLSEEYKALTAEYDALINNNFKLKEKLNNLSGMSATDYREYLALKDKVKIGVNANYANMTKEELDKFNRLNAKVNSGDTILYQNQAWKDQWDEMCNTVEEARNAYKAESKYYSDSYDYSQVNSFLDVIKLGVSNIFFGNDANIVKASGSVLDKCVVQPMEILKSGVVDFANKVAQNAEVYNTQEHDSLNIGYMGSIVAGLVKTTLDLFNPIVDKDGNKVVAERDKYGAPIKYVTGLDQVKSNITKAGTVFLNNNLVNLAETFDITNQFIKPYLVGSMAYRDIVWNGADASNYSDNLTSVVYNTVNQYGTGTEEYRGVSNADIAGWYAFKNTWGANGNDPVAYEFDQVIKGDNLSDTIMSMVLDIMFDPGTYNIGEMLKESAFDAESFKAYYDTLSKTGDLIKASDAADSVRVPSKFIPLNRSQAAEYLFEKNNRKIQDAIIDSLNESGIHIYAENMDTVRQYIREEVNKMFKRVADTDMSLINLNSTLSSSLASEYKNAANAVYNFVTAPTNKRALQTAEEYTKTGSRVIDNRILETASNYININTDVAKAFPLQLGTGYKVIKNSIAADDIKQIGTKLIFAAAAPGVSVPLYAVKALKYVNNTFNSKALLSTIDTMLTRTNKKVQAFVSDKTPIINKDIKAFVGDITNEIGVAIRELLKDGNIDNSTIGFLDTFRSGMFDTLVSDVINNDLEPFKEILKNKELSSVQKISALNEYVAKNLEGYNTFEEFFNECYLGTSIDKTIYENSIKELENLSPKGRRIIESVNLDFRRVMLHAQADPIRELSDKANDVIAELRSTFDVINDTVLGNASKSIDTYADYMLTNTAVLDDVTEYQLHGLASMAYDFTNTADTRFIKNTNLISATDELLNTIDDVVKVATPDNYNKLNDAFTAYVDAQIKYIDNANTSANELLINTYDATTYKILPGSEVNGRLTTDSVVAAITDYVAERTGVDASVIDKDIINNAIIKNADDLVVDGKVDIDSVTRLYKIISDKNTKVKNVINDYNVMSAVDAVLDTNSKEYATILTLIEQDNDIIARNFFDTCRTIKNTQTFINDFEYNIAMSHSLDVTDSMVYAIEDAFVGSSSNLINKITSELGTSKQSINYLSDRITDNILYNATEYLNQKGDTPFYRYINKGCNKVDTENNVKNMLDVIHKNTVGGKKIAEVFEEDSDKYIDVFYSTSKSFEHADPNMISFGRADGAITTFRSNAPFDIKGQSAYNLYGMDSVSAINEWNEISKRVPALEKDIYINRINDYMHSVYEEASKSGKQVRFIGFNSSDIYSESERFITELATRNNMQYHVNIHQDIADMMRKENGFIDIPSNARNTLKQTVTKTLYDLNAQAYDFGTTKLVMDANENIYVTFNDLYRHVDNNFNQYSKYLEGMQQSIVASDLNTGAGFVGTMNSAYGMVINEKVICDAINMYATVPNPNIRANCTEIIKKAFIEDPQHYQANVKSLLNKQLLQNWFTDENIVKLLGESDIDTKAETVYKIMQNVENTYERIQNPTVIQHIGKDVIADMYQYTMEYILKQPKSSAGYIMNIYNKLNLTNEFEYYAALMSLRNRYPELVPDAQAMFSHLDVLNVFKENNYNKYVQAIEQIFDNEGAARYVFNTANTVRYDYSDVLTDPKYLKLVQDNNLAMEQLNELARSTKDIQDLGMLATLKESILQNSGLYTPQEQLQTILFAPVYDALKNLNDGINAKVADTIKDYLDDPIASTVSNTLRNEDIAQLKAAVKNMNDSHKVLSTRTVFALSDEDYVAHIIRNGLGGQIIDLDAKFLDYEDTRALIAAKLKSVSDSGLCKVEQIVRESDGTWRLYQGKDDPITRTYTRVTPTILENADADEIYVRYKDFKLNIAEAYANNFKVLNVTDTVSSNDVYISDLFKNYLYSISDKMPDAYFASSFETMTQATYKSFQEAFDVSARLGGEYGSDRFTTWLDDAFNCSIIGDIDLHQCFNMYASDNLMNNLTMGAHHVRKNLEATTDYFALLSNPHVSLKSMCKQYGIDLTHLPSVDADAIAKSVEARGYVIAGFTGTEGDWNLTKIDLSNHNKYDYLTKDNVICISNENFMEIQQYAKKQSKQWTYEHASNFEKHMIDQVDRWKSTMRAARTYSYLMLPFAGPGIRNLFDANWKAINELGVGNYSYYAANALEWNKSYTDILGDMLLKGDSNISADLISEYFATHPNAPISEKLFTEIHTFKASSAVGLTDLYDIKRKNQTNTLKGLLREGSTVNEIDLKCAQRIYQKVYDMKQFRTRGDKPLAAMQSKANELLSKHFSGDKLDDLTKLFYNYTAEANTWSNKLADSKLLGTYMNFNAELFEAPETISRLGMYLYKADGLGEVASKANLDVIKTQFNYNARPKLIDKLEVLFPFSTYKIYNSLYWLTDAPKDLHVIQNANRITKAFDSGYNSEELALVIRNGIMRNMLYNGELNSDEDSEVVYTGDDTGKSNLIELVHLPGSTIEQYKGMPSMYAEGIKLGNNHVLKLGNSYVEGIEFMQSIITAPFEIASGQLPRVLGDSLYSPLSTLLTLMSEHASFNRGAYPNEDSASFFIRFVKDNHYDTADMLPFFGTLYNNTLNHFKNGRVNLTDLMLQNVLPNLDKDITAALYEATWNILGTVAPSLVGTVYDSTTLFDKEVGYDWYNNTNIDALMRKGFSREEAEAYIRDYKNTHRYVFGMSDFASFLTKEDAEHFHNDPANYFNYKGMYEAMGIDPKEVSTLLGILFGQDLDNNVQYNPYYTIVDADGNIHFNFDRVNDTLTKLVEKGYTVEAAMNLIKFGNNWVDPVTGAIKTSADLEAAILNSEFLGHYDELPDYIKYDKQQYKYLMEYYKSLGYTTEEAWSLMKTTNGYMIETGNYVILTDKQVADYTAELNANYLNFKNDLPEWFRYDQDALNRTTKYVSEMFPHMSMEQVYNYIIKNNFYVEEDGTGHKLIQAVLDYKAKEYNDNGFLNNCPDYIRYESGAISRTLAYLRSLGISNNDAKQMITNGAYYTVDGRLINCSDLQKQRTSNTFTRNFKEAFGESGFTGYKDFQSYYASLPPAIKYTKGAFKQINDVLKELGYTYEQRLMLIQQGLTLTKVSGAGSNISISANASTALRDFLNKYGDKYITINGELYKYTDANTLKSPSKGWYNYSKNSYNYYKRPYTKKTYTKKQYNNVRSKKYSKPKISYAIRHNTYVKHVDNPYTNKNTFSSTYSKVNVLAGSSYGARKVYKVNLGNNPVRQAMSIKSTYPASYRNISYSNRRNMYKDLYAKYGLSRMLMRSNATHVYSNASITRLRRNEIQNRVTNGKQKPKTLVPSRL